MPRSPPSSARTLRITSSTPGTARSAWSAARSAGCSQETAEICGKRLAWPGRGEDWSCWARGWGCSTYGTSAACFILGQQLRHPERARDLAGTGRYPRRDPSLALGMTGCARDDGITAPHNAWSRSAIRSSASSIPQLSRTRLSVSPISCRIATGTAAWVMRRRMADQALHAAQRFGEGEDRGCSRRSAWPARGRPGRSRSSRRSRSSGGRRARAAGCDRAAPGSRPAARLAAVREPLRDPPARWRRAAASEGAGS